MKHAKQLIFGLLVLLLLAVPALAIDIDAGSGDSFFVVDQANVLSSETQAQIVEYNTQLESYCSEAQFVVVTVSYLDEDSDVASLQLLDDWGVGSAEESNGMLLLYVANEQRGWLSTGDGIDGAFTDSMAQDYMDDYFWRYADKSQPDKAVLTLAEHIVDWYQDYYDVDFDTSSSGGSYGDYAPYPDYAVAPQRSSAFSSLFSLLLTVLIIWLIVSLSRHSRMRRWGYTGGFWPVFWIFSGPGMWRSWRRRGPGFGPGPHPGPGPHVGPGPGMNFRTPPRGGGFGGGGHGGGFGGGHGGGFGGHGGGFGGGSHGGGFGGHGGGGGGGRR